MQIGIITDDLTSATDGAAAFAARGWSAEVVTGNGTYDSDPCSDVLSVNAASRTLPMPAALERVRAAVARVAGCRTLVKQFDSTLRGHVAAETLVVLRETGRQQVVVAAAFPSAGRVTIGGQQRVNGIPVHTSSYGGDILNPVVSSDLPALFAAEGVTVSTDHGANTTVVVLDAQSERDLDDIVDTCCEKDNVLLAGSTGLVRALARRSRFPRSLVPHARARGSRVLIVVGSLNRHSRQQMELLAQRKVPVIVLSEQFHSASTVEFISSLFAVGRSAVILKSREVLSDPWRVSDELGRAASELIRLRVTDGLIVTGGETLGSILKHLEVRTLKVCGELEPGVPICVFHAPSAISLVSKAGGFGTPEVFVEALRELQR